MEKGSLIVFFVFFIGVSAVFVCRSCFSGFLGEFGSFASAFVRSPKNVGSFIPSSSYLSKAMTKYIVKKESPIKILEVGAGTGVITAKIIEKIGNGDLLDVIEIDPKLCKVLKKKFKRYKNVRVHGVSILEWKPDCQYDFIVSALPFNSFNAQMVGFVLDKYKDWIKNNGVLSYVELRGARKKKYFLRGEKKQDFKKNMDARVHFKETFEFDKDRVFLNVPPARVYHLRIKK